ncbi:neurotensin receptor type 1-like [Littorina saxatilis]|uniref:neurotensin receptor type 1-like n=1 Tax=Littorina saxatilis TaxID=31220 RepID=UPI0038B51413
MERYVAICRPLLATRRRHSRLPAIAVTWLVSIALCVPFIFIASLDEVEYYDDSVELICRTSSKTLMSRVFFLVDFILCLILPLLAITFFYCAIVFKLTPRHCCQSRSKADTFNIHSTNHQDSRAMSRRQVIRMMVAVVAVFYICLLPFRCIAIVTVFGSSEQIQRLGFTGYQMILQTTRLLTFVNSASNPVIYGLMCTKFRKAFTTALPFSCWRREARRPNSSSKLSTYAGVSTRLYQLRSTKRGRLTSTSGQENGEAESIRSGGLVLEGPDEDDKYTSEDVGGQVGRARTDYFGD